MNFLLNKNHAMRCRIGKPRGLKVRLSAACFIDSNEYLALFPGSTLSDKSGVTVLNEILLNIMPNSWSNQAYVQGFDCNYITKRNKLTCLNA